MTNNNINDLLANLPIDRIAAQIGEDPSAVRAATENLLPTLLAGMGANAQVPEGRDSLAQAVSAHDPSLVTGDVDVEAIDTNDGAKIARNIFGSNEDQVISQLGGLGGGSDLVKKLMPILAPLAMSWLAGKLTQQSSGSNTQAQGGLLEQILGQVAGGSSQGSLGGIFGDILGGLLGGGRR